MAKAKADPRLDAEVAKELERRLAAPDVQAEIERRVQEELRRHGLDVKADPTSLAVQQRDLEVQKTARIAERQRLSLRLVNDPRDTEADRDLRRINEQIAAIDAQIAIRRDAHELAVKVSSVNDRCAELARIHAWQKAATECADKRVLVLKTKFRAGLKMIEDALQEVASLSAECSANAARVGHACDDGSWLYQSQILMEPAHGTSGGMTAALLSELYDAGVGRTGIQIPRLYGDNGMPGSPLSLVGAAALDASRLEARLSEMVGRKCAEFKALDDGVLPVRERMRQEQQEREAGDRAEQARLKEITSKKATKKED